MDAETVSTSASPGRRDDRGASLVEYALLLALIAIVCIGAVTFFGSGGVGASLDRSGSSIFLP